MTTPNLDYAAAAEAVPCFEHWLRRNIGRIPHQKVGRMVSFTADDIAEIRRVHAQRPGTPDADGRVTRGRNPQSARRAA